MNIEGWYYLHTNGSLIYKRNLVGTVADIRESDFARMLWPCIPADRMSAWRMLVEATALGADQARVKELADKWGCNDTDADEYASRLGITLALDGNAWCATPSFFVNLQVSPAGFGDSKLASLAELAKALHYQPSKMWGRSFHDLVASPKESCRGA